MSAAAAHYYTELRRPKHILPMAVDKRAVAIAHHRRYHDDSFCMNRDAAHCENIDGTDREYAEELEEVLAYLPDWPSSTAVE
jgi:hypothetical protein